jgi:hypothetical protein
MLGPDRHSSEYQAALEALNEFWAHCYASQLCVFTVDSYSGAAKENESVDVETGFEQS